MKHKQVIMPVFVPHMGCPHACVFCDQYRITRRWQPPRPEELAAMAQAWQASCGAAPELAFYGGSFTAIAPALQEALLGAAAALVEKGAVSRIRLSTRPDALDDNVLARLAYYGVETVEIGVQSLDDDVLAASQRGHTAATAMQAIERVKAAGFRCGAQLMLALPQDTPEKSLATCRKVIDLAPDLARIYPTAVIRGTALAERYAAGQYVPWPFDTVLDTAAMMLDMFSSAQIPVIRIGLQAEDNLSQGDVIAGAYHPALGELVKARRFRQRMQALLSENETAPVTFAVAPRYLSQAIGQHRENLTVLSAQTGQPVHVVADACISSDNVERR